MASATDVAIDAAIKDSKHGKYPSIQAVAKAHRVAKSTLADRLQGNSHFEFEANAATLAARHRDHACPVGVVIGEAWITTYTQITTRNGRHYEPGQPRRNYTWTTVAHKDSREAPRAPSQTKYYDRYPVLRGGQQYLLEAVIRDI